MLDHYILKDKIPVKCGMYEWAIWLNSADRRVAFTDMGICSVSTVFLGLNHNFGYGPPLLFETMVFGVNIDELEDTPMKRYSTWEQAEDGHNKIVAEMRRKLFKSIEGGAA